MTVGWEKTGIAHHWSPPPFAHEDVAVQSGRPPRMTHEPWSRLSRDTETAATAPGEIWWRCRESGCRRFAGPYRDFGVAVEVSREHARLHYSDLLAGRPKSRGRSR